MKSAMDEFKKSTSKPRFVNNGASSAQLVALMASSDPEVLVYQPLIERRLYATTPWKIVASLVKEMIVPMQGQIAALETENTELKARLASFEAEKTDLQSRLAIFETEFRSRLTVLEERKTENIPVRIWDTESSTLRPAFSNNGSLTQMHISDFGLGVEKLMNAHIMEDSDASMDAPPSIELEGKDYKVCVIGSGLPGKIGIERLKQPTARKLMREIADIVTDTERIDED